MTIEELYENFSPDRLEQLGSLLERYITDLVHDEFPDAVLSSASISFHLPSDECGHFPELHFNLFHEPLSHGLGLGVTESDEMLGL